MKYLGILRQRFIACLVSTLCLHGWLMPIPAQAKKPKKTLVSATAPALKAQEPASDLQPLTGSEVQNRKVTGTAIKDTDVSPAASTDNPSFVSPSDVSSESPVQAKSVESRLLDSLGSGAYSPVGLTLSQLLQAAADTYPLLVAARTETRASAQDVSAMERLRWPTLSATVESDTGNLRSYPNKAIQVDQTLWDAGRNTARINESKVLAEISLIKVYLQQQDIFLQITNAWQNMIGSRERLKVADKTIKRLKEYQLQMRRRVQAEASPLIDLELVDSRLLQTDVEWSTAKTSLQVALTRLAQFTGEEDLDRRSASVRYADNPEQTDAFFGEINSLDWYQLSAAHPAVAKARHELQQVKERMLAKNAEAFPQVFARVYKPLEAIPGNADLSTTAFLGLRYSPGAGFANVVEAQAMGTRVVSSEQAVQAVMRDIQQSFENDREEFLNARTRMGALQRSVQGSEKVLDSYQRQFQAGRKTWLDLLNAVRELAQNEYALADAKAGMVAAMNRLQIRMGQDPQ